VQPPPLPVQLSLAHLPTNLPLVGLAVWSCEQLKGVYAHTGMSHTIVRAFFSTRLHAFVCVGGGGVCLDHLASLCKVPQHKVCTTFGVLDASLSILLFLLLHISSVLLLLLLLLLLSGQPVGPAALLQVPDTLCEGCIRQPSRPDGFLHGLGQAPKAWKWKGIIEYFGSLKRGW
jgi:hypothetical protein